MISDDTIVSEKNVAYVANKGNEIRQLKFIESTGTQYIDTGYIPNNNTKLDITFFTTGQSSLGGICVTNLNANNQQGFGIYVNATNYGNEIFVDDGTVKSFNREYKIHAILDKNQFYKNEVLVGTFSTSTFTCNNTLPIFCLNRNGSIEQFSKTKLYECKLYDNDVLVRDFIPAKQGNKVGLWENVDGIFYGNSGTGSFVAGPEALYDPSYQELEYIEGNATTTSDGPYIDTGNILNQDAVVIADYQFVNTTNWISCAIFGSRSSADNNCFGFMARNDSTTPNETSLAMRWDYRNTQTKTASGALNKERELVTACKNELRFKNSSVLTASYSTFTCNNSLRLLAYYSQGKLDSCANAKLYSAEIYCSYKNQFFVPAKRVSDNVVGMYELYEKKFYSNPNTTGREFGSGDEVQSVSIMGNSYEDEPANLATVARLFNFEKKSLYLDKPLSIARLKYFYNKNLANQNPYGGYTQLEYIEANGNQWIDTGFKPNQDTSIEFHCEVHTDSEAVSPLFGSRTSINGSQAYVLWLYNGNYRFDYQAQKSSLTGVTNTGRRYIFAGGYDNVIKIDQKTWNLGNYTFSVPNNLYIFGMMENAGLDDRHPSGKIYLCNIFSGPGTDYMERRFIPAKRNSDGVSGLLDILDCTFYESLGEPWIAGPEVGPVPNFALDGYSFVEYAKSSTETYVDTEFTPNQDSRVIMEMEKVANSTSIAQYIFCSRYSGMPEYGILKPANESRWRDGYARERTFLGNGETGASLTQRMIIDKNKNVTYIGHGTVNHTYTNFTTPNTMALYGCFEDGDGTINYDIDMYLYWCRIYDNGILIRNYYPAIRLSDSVVGLYDFVNEKFVTPIQGTLTARHTIPINIS